MRRYSRTPATPNEDELQDEIWDDESPVRAPERAEPPTMARVGLHPWREAIAYRTRWILLQMFGPAQQDDEHDPIVALKRRYHRPL